MALREKRAEVTPRVTGNTDGTGQKKMAFLWILLAEDIVVECILQKLVKSQEKILI